jgi:hypothetical protein
LSVREYFFGEDGSHGSWFTNSEITNLHFLWEKRKTQ